MTDLELLEKLYQLREKTIESLKQTEKMIETIKEIEEKVSLIKNFNF